MCKGRVMEATLCGALLMEQRNRETETWFTEDKHYVGFSGEKELLEKVRYFLAHSEERMTIAKTGHEHAVKNYAARKYWEAVITKFAPLSATVR